MSVEEQIIEKVRALPPELAGEERKPFRSPEGILADLDFDLENVA